MNYKDNAETLSNTSIVDIFFIDSLSEKFDYGDELEPRDIVNLARLIETFVLCNEVVIREDHVVWDPMLHYNNDYDYKFTGNWIQTFSKNNVIQVGAKSASTLLTNEYANFNSISRRMLGIYGEDSLEYYLLKDREDSTITWSNIAKYGGIPFITDDLSMAYNDVKRFTNISLDLYNKMENYYKDYFSEISKYLGPTTIRIPSLLSMVLQEIKHIEDIPQITMQIRDTFSNFIMEVTELEYKLRVSKSIAEQIEITKLIKNCYDNIVSYKEKGKTRIQSRIFDVVQNLDLMSMASETIKQVRDVNVEEKGLLLVPGYYNLWQAAEEVEQALPLLKRVFGKQINDEFLTRFSELSDI